MAKKQKNTKPAATKVKEADFAVPKQKEVKPARRSFIKPVIIVASIVIISLAGIYFFWNFSGKERKSTTVNTNTAAADTINSAPGVSQGSILAHTYCQSCHLFPEPSLLNKAKWNNVLPQMGIRLGIRSFKGQLYVNAVAGDDLVVPEHPVLTDEQWQSIMDYFLITAPETLPKQSRQVEITRQMPWFSMQMPAPSFASGKALATYVKIDTTVKPARVFVANGFSQKLFLLDNKLNITDSVKTTGPVVDISFNNGDLLVCSIGKELGANSDRVGNVSRLHLSRSGKMKFDGKPVFSKLARPVQVVAADLNGDHKTDYLVCEFGNLTGALSWMENRGDGTFTRRVVSNLPGAIKAYLDYSHDKNLPDLWVLFTQGQENITHFINKGSGKFEEKRVLRFPPIYGSSSFEMVDINHDGYKDIIYTCGDNGNSTMVLKPYHGVYIYLNDGHDNFTQEYFFPVNGCYKAIARDFDGDGNIDIATVSLYTDAQQPEEGFVYLKNTGNLNFVPYALPPGTKFERGITMDAADLDGDGKPDLLIGNSYFDYGAFRANIAETLFFVLKNEGQGPKR